MLYLVLFEKKILQNTAIFSNIFKSKSTSLKIECFGKKTQRLWGKNSSILRKNSSFSASKLNKPVVTNYTRYHKSVEKKPAIIAILSRYVQRQVLFLWQASQ